MSELLSIKAIAAARAKAYDSGLSATCKSLSELRRNLSAYKEASEGIAKLGIVQSAPGIMHLCLYTDWRTISALENAKLGIVQSARDVRQRCSYEYWSLKSALDYAGVVATSRPRSNWYGARREVRSAACVESGQARAVVIDGRRMDVVSTFANPSGSEMRFRHEHGPEVKNWTSHLFPDYPTWFISAGAVSMTFSGYELLLAKGSPTGNLIKSIVVTAALMVVPAISKVIDMLPKRTKKPEDAERVLEPQQFLAEVVATYSYIVETLKSMESELGLAPPRQ